MAAQKKKTEKKTAKKKPAAAKKKPAGKKTAAKKTAEKKAPAAKKSGFPVADVNMGHIFALRPRVAPSFRPDDLRLAKQHLEDETFKTSADAARAVAEKALEMSQEGAVPGRKKHERRF
jgi:hypothetical protein